MSTEIQNVQSPAVVEAEPKKLEGEALKEAILRQVDYYFSRQNLSNDAYLVSQMRKDAKGMYVALKTIAAFTKVKNLSEDLQLITEVMKTSKSVAVDETAGDIILRPTHLNATRNTLMLRDIPSSTDQETIKQIFVNEKSAVPLSLQSAIGDNWFITFESEADAVKALEYIRTQTFNGKKMSGCLKSENLLKSSTFPVKNGDAPAETSTGPIFQAQGMPYPQQRWNRNPPMPQPYTATTPFEFYDNTYRQNKSRPYSANPRRGGAAAGASQPRRKDGSPTYHKKGQYQASNGATPQLATPQTNPTAEQIPIASPAQPAYNARQPKQSSTQPTDAQNAAKKSTPGAEKKRRGSKGQGRQAMPNLTANDFPPLPSVGKDENKTGYETTFKRYTKQEIIEVVSTLGSGNAPTELPADVPAVLPTANTELELLKPLPKSDKGEEKVEPAVKSFAEAAITAKDIKTPEHKDGRTRRNSKRSENVITASTATNSKRSGKAAQPETTDSSAESTPASTPAAEDEFKEVKHSKRSRKNVPQVQQPQTASSPAEGENAAATATADATDATVDAILKKKAQKNNRQRRNNTEPAAEQSQEQDSKKATTYADIVAAKKAAAEKSKQEAAAAEKSAATSTDAVSPPGK